MNEINGFLEFISEVQKYPLISYENNLPNH
jgi:hypothetical protein